MNPILLIYVAILIYLYHKLDLYWRRNSKPKHLAHLKDVPMVDSELPFVGHGLSFSKNIPAFIEECRVKYGNIFRVKIFRTDMIIVCDKNLVDEFFAAKEDKLSLNHTLNRLFFGDAFAVDENFLHTIIPLVKQTIRVNFDEFTPKIQSEANKLIKKMIHESEQNFGKTEISVNDFMMKFVACTSAKCFMGIDLTDSFFNTLSTFAFILNKIVILTYFIPKPILRFVLKPILSIYRDRMIRALVPLINQYRADTNLADSQVLRKAVDYVDSTGKHLTDMEIGGIIVCLLYVSSENTSLGLSATIADLATWPDYWQRVRAESFEYIKNNNFAGMFKDANKDDNLLNACFLESSRMNTHVFPLNRYPVDKNCALGNYYIGSAVSVGICAPVMMRAENNAAEKFTNPGRYEPERFMPGRLEPKTSTDIVTFGAKTHLCPGKQFARMEIFAAVSLITNYFDPFTINNLPELDYFSPSAFAERKINAIVSVNKNMTKFATNGSETDQLNCCQIEIIEISDDIDPAPKGLLIKNWLSQSEQINLYNYIIGLSDNSVEHTEIQNASTKFGYPITYYNLVYTNTSNCERPTTIFDLSKKIFEYVRTHTQLVLPEFEPNSIHAQLFGENNTLVMHKDQYCDWGMSISLGASCDFVFGSNIIKLESGDIFVADFSQVQHGITKMYDDKPGWMNDDSGCDVKTFDKVRMSIQVRDIGVGHFNKRQNDGFMTIDEFKKMAGVEYGN